ncbi:hypothetical protein PENTCL1PPCAC_7759, partial [Pristionchus entomophagus]
VCSLPAIYEEPIDVIVEEGGKLELKVPSSVNIWHREFADGRSEYVEFPNQYLEVSNVWRGGDMFHTHDPTILISLNQDGYVILLQVTAAASAKYFTYYMGDDHVHHYSYFNVKIGN